MVTQAQLNNHKAVVNNVADNTFEYVKAQLQAMAIIEPNAEVARMRMLAIDIVNNAIALYGEQACIEANRLFAEIANEAGLRAVTEIADDIDKNKIEEKIKKLANALVKGDQNSFIQNTSEYAAYLAKRCAFSNMIENCKNNRVRWARVPSGRETCAFCFMLASRGFVYHSQWEAGGAGHDYHRHCDCEIIPNFQGGQFDHVVEGYKPDELHERYLDCRNVVTQLNDKNTIYDGKEEAKRIKKEIETRDFEWLYKGIIPKVTKMADANVTVGSLEWQTAERLSQHGIKCEFKKDCKYNSTKKGGIEGYADLTGGIELKTLTSTKSKNTIISHYRNARSKKDIKRCYFDNSINANLPDEALIRILQEKKYAEFGIYVLTKENKLIKIN